MEEPDALVAYFEAEIALPLAGEWEDLPERDYVAEYQAGLDAARGPLGGGAQSP